eukprot:scaffold115_cov304-Prasinococcus_capsulatus_cf.AAC.21
MAQVKYGDAAEAVYSEGAVGFFDDPYVIMVTVGAVLIFVSIKGLVGGLCSSKRVLLIYYTLEFFLLGFILYAVSLCFFARDQANAMVARWWARWQDTFPDDITQDKVVSQIHKTLNTVRAPVLCSSCEHPFDSDCHRWQAGALLSVCGVLTLLNIWCASRIMGHGYALKHTTQILNILIVVSGGVLIYFTVITVQRSYGGSWAPYVVGTASGLCILFGSVSARLYWGLSSHSLTAWLSADGLVICWRRLVVQALQTGKSERQDLIEDNWDFLQEKVVGNVTIEEAVDITQRYDTLLGVLASITLLICIINLIAAIRLLIIRRRRRLQRNYIYNSDGDYTSSGDEEEKLPQREVSLAHMDGNRLRRKGQD